MVPLFRRFPSSIVTAVSFVALLVSASAGCSLNWTQFQSSCYRFMNYTAYWHDGQERCQEMGATLLVIESSDENSFIEQELHLRSMSLAWLGCTDVEIEGEWKCRFADGVRAMPYADWKSGQPNNLQGRQDCAFVRSDTGKWADHDCRHDKNYAVCETNGTQLQVVQPAGLIVSSRVVATSCYVIGADWRLKP